MPSLSDVVNYCDELTQLKLYKDFPGAENGLQLANEGTVHKIGAAVDAGLVPFREAITRGIDFLIVHHGMFWNPPQPFVGVHYEKLKTAMDGNLAVYSSHLPLDAHHSLGNNTLLAQALHLQPERFFLEYEGQPIALIASHSGDRDELVGQMQDLFPDTCKFVLHGSDCPKQVAILSGSGRSALAHLKREGVDTLITGELRQEHYNYAQEHGLNLMLGGHYATETFGVQALARKVAEKFNLDWEFIPFPCPL
jgi:dinuclear metal center YbgI/SA1388 family protein